MQFHLDGYRVGDPEMLPAAADAMEASEPLADEVDVLIVGCGPAGLVLAAQLAAFPDIKTRIVDRRPGGRKPLTGHPLRFASVLDTFPSEIHTFAVTTTFPISPGGKSP